MKNSFFNYSFDDLRTLFEEKNLNPHVANLLYNWHYKKKNLGACTKDVSKEAQKFVEENFDFSLPEIDTVQEASDRTVKFLFKLQDGSKVETVLIPFYNKYAICLSSQVGCAMKCSFCFTGTQGLKRNLAPYEIVGQFLEAWRWIVNNRPGEERILNIVFMGQGEPLHNFDNVKKACEIFLSRYGTSVAMRKITISTSGFVPGLKRWKEEMPNVNLALSLHSPFAEKRNELIPINKRYPLEEVLGYIHELPLEKKQFIIYEYLLIDGFNDGVEDAMKTGELLKGKEAYINLIPFNPFPGTEYKRPSLEKVEAFKAVLDTYKIPTLIRGTKGDDILAACGQLNSKEAVL